MLSNDEESISGTEIVKIIKETPLDHTDIPESTQSIKTYLKTFKNGYFYEGSKNGISTRMNGNNDTNGSGNQNKDEIVWENPIERLGIRGNCIYSGGEGIVFFERPASGNWDQEFQISEKEVENVVNMIIGDVNILDLLTPDITEHKLNQVFNI